MDSAYDEILSENPFFVKLRTEYSEFFQHCISQSWIICVPRIGSLNTFSFSLEDFCAHILVPSDELPETHFITLTDKQASVINKVITLEITKDLPLHSHILFEETFYTEDLYKYRVWCIETPLELCKDADFKEVSKENLSSINDCIDLLWTQAFGRSILDLIEQKVKQFMKKSMQPVTVVLLRDSVSELYTECLQLALRNRRLRNKSQVNKLILENVKIAIESYIEHLLFDTLFKYICTCCAYEDAHFNKKIRNMADIQLRDLDIKKSLYHAVPKAKQILSKIDTYNTVLEKVSCLKRTLNTISVEDNENSVPLTADDLLPVFVFLVIKSGLPNWISQLTFMKEFRFSGIGKGDGDESAFLITTLEAVIEHIQSGALTGPPEPESYYHESNLTKENVASNGRKNSLTESVSTSDTNCNGETLDYIFELIKADNSEQACAILVRNQNYMHKTNLNLEVFSNNSLSDKDSDEEETGVLDKLCHPLCDCSNCCRKISKNILKTYPTVNSRDGHGLTSLHIACIHGKARAVESLIDLGANINATDLNECTPLHYAASKGHQNALLLLLHSGAFINKKNVDENTSLHLAVNNGHMNCVKALIYFAEHNRKKLLFNVPNINGNTPLHLASKWGYEGIARLLIENGCDPSLLNKDGKSAFDYAHNLRILQVLKSSTPNLYEYIHISNADILLNCQRQECEQLYDSFNNNLKIVNKLKTIDRILKAITYGDVKLACFYMNINYAAYVNQTHEISCHPFCQCDNCKDKTLACTTNFDVNDCDVNKYTALHLASQYGLHDLCDILIYNKANVNVANLKGQTPLHLAAMFNKCKVIELLFKHGANVNAKDSLGNTPLHVASDAGNIGAAKIILKNNPDLSLNGLEMSALDIAKNKIHLTIIDLIETYRNKTE